MKLLLACMAFGLLVLAETPFANAQNCVDPPVSLSGKCWKEAGARCDPGSRRWRGGTFHAYDACLQRNKGASNPKPKR